MGVFFAPCLWGCILYPEYNLIMHQNNQWRCAKVKQISYNSIDAHSEKLPYLYHSPELLLYKYAKEGI